MFCDRPCWLFFAIASITGTTAGKIVLRNGFDVDAEIINRVVCGYIRVTVVPFDPPLYFNRGLFVQFIGNIYGVTVQFLPEG